MAKKMTQKEFWEVMEDIGKSKNIYGYEGLLNYISILIGHEAERDRAKDYKEMATINDRYAQRIYDYLDSRGYYDECPSRTNN